MSYDIHAFLEDIEGWDEGEYVATAPYGDHEHVFVGHIEGVQCKICRTPYWHIDPEGNRKGFYE